MVHEHHFGQAEPRAGEARTRIVVFLTAVTMVVEITIDELNVGDGKTKLDIPGWGGLTLDRADVGNLDPNVPIILVGEHGIQ